MINAKEFLMLKTRLEEKEQILESLYDEFRSAFDSNLPPKFGLSDEVALNIKRCKKEIAVLRKQISLLSDGAGL